MSTSLASTGRMAEAPSPERLSGVAKLGRDFVWLLRGELFLLREAWFWYLIQATFASLSYLFFLWFFVGQRDADTMTFLVTGSLVSSLSFAGMLSLGQHLGALKNANAFEYYASLPITKAVFVAAVTTRGVLLTLPSTLLILLLGWTLFDLVVPPLGLLVLLLSAYAMCGFGAVIGFWSPTAQVASLVTQILWTIIIFFAPIFYPLEALPTPLQVTAHLWPTTYAAEALRAVVAGAAFASLWRPLIVLVGFVVVSMVLVPLKLDWRGR